MDNKISFILGNAALLHDIGKEFTKSFINSKGEKTDIAHYYNHNNVSAYLSLIYNNVFPSLDILEISNYIQWHMQPFFLTTQKSQEKFIKLVGQEFWENLLLIHKADLTAH
jgi:CRISPR/Cas system-associated endonuclease Cas3-HD